MDPHGRVLLTATGKSKSPERSTHSAAACPQALHRLARSEQDIMMESRALLCFGACGTKLVQVQFSFHLH